MGHLVLMGKYIFIKESRTTELLHLLSPGLTECLSRGNQ